MQEFKKGVPVWPVGEQGTWNQVVGFHAAMVVDEPCVKGNLVLRMTAADCYRVWVNGVFVGYGPARTAHGFSRVDEWPLAGLANEGVNHLAVEVSNAGIDSYAYALHDPFLQAEVLFDDNVVVATGGDAFAAYLLKERIQKVERYSKQRPFAEAYRLAAGCNDWRIGQGGREPIASEKVDACELLPRHVPLPDFCCVDPVRILEQGSVIEASGPESVLHHVARDKVGVRVMGYPVDELAIDMSRELLHLGFVPSQANPPAVGIPAEAWLRIAARGYALYDFGSVQGGFIEARLRCDAPTRVYLKFDEILNRQPEEIFKLGVGAIALDLEPGEHAFTSFEPYSMGTIRVIACDAPIEVCTVRIREYAHPVPEPLSPFDDTELAAILRAGWQTFRTNSVDLFTDCMSRERGGYPCDSYFTARTELALTGESRVERNFLENYFLVDTFASIPEGMVPHCYPSDRLGKGQYIPNWGLWLVLQLCEYCLRTGDDALRDLARSRVEALFGWFAKHRNTQGLLEDVPGWLFVEWSDANNYTDGVSHPTNMLYARCLGAAAELYGRDDWQAASLQTAAAVCQESWDGRWFADQSTRVDGVLQRSAFRSETCQYHALFCQVATSGQAASLWQRLRDDCGPLRGAHGEGMDGTGVNLLPAELLYGLMLRFDLLQKAGERERLVTELRHVFGPMARQSGTLWEHVEPRASLNHGFASYASALLLA